jgi:DNA-binding GntR family transcriptional regulator
MFNKTSDIKEDMTLTDKAYHKIKDRILTADLKPGQYISINAMANNMSMSRTPVREAINKLEIEGLIKNYPNGGKGIVELSKKDVKEIFYLRIILEKAALNLSINNIPKEELNELEERFNSVNIKSKKLSNEEKISLFELDKALHGLIVEYSYNNKLKNFINMLNNQIEIARGISAVRPGRLEKSLEEHKNILNLLKEKKLKEAKEYLENHLKKIEKNVIEINDSIERYI